MSTEEGNKLIAEFIDRYHGRDIIECEAPIVVKKVYNGFSGELREEKTRPFTYSDLKYHSSWDWLMPVWGHFRHLVWEKFNSSSPNDFVYFKSGFMNCVFNEDIIGAQMVMVEAIEWLNKETKVQK